MEPAHSDHARLDERSLALHRLVEARAEANLPTAYEAENVELHGFDGDRPRVTCRRNGAQHEIACDFIAGCDGFHGIFRQSVPDGAVSTFERVYPFGWLGVLVDQPPVAPESRQS